MTISMREDLGQLPGGALASAGWRWRAARAELALFRVVLMAYCVIVVLKLHELFPRAAAELYPGKIAGGLLVITALFAVPRQHLRGLSRATPTKWLAMVVVLAVVTAPFGIWPGGSVLFLIEDYWKDLLFFVIAGAAWVDRRTLKLCLAALVTGASVLALALLLRFSAIAGGRFYAGPSRDPNETALLLLVVIPFALYLASSARGVARWGWFASALLLVGGIARTASRGGVLGLLVLAAWLIYQAPGWRRVIYAAGVLAAVIAFRLAADAASWQRLATITDPTADYNYDYPEGRLQVWKRGIGYFAEHPFLGVGVRNFPVAEGVLGGKTNEGSGIKFSAAHNSFIEVAVELGLPGLVAFIGMLWAAAAGCRRIRAVARPGATGALLAPVNERDLANAGLGALVAWLVAGSFLSFAYDVVTLAVVAFCVAVWTGSPLARYYQQIGAVRSWRAQRAPQL